MQPDTLATHDGSKSHLQCKDAAIAKEAQRLNQPTTASDALKSLNKGAIEKLSILFNNAHAVASEAKPFVEYEFLNRAQERNGLVLGKTYRNDKACRNFVHSISQVQRNVFRKEISADVNYLALMSDGSIDSSVTENEIVYIIYAIKGKIYVHFIGIQAVEKADAPHLREAIMKTCEMYGVDAEVLRVKLVAFGCDGASVNLGKNAGLVVLLKELVRNIHALGVHCYVHRLELTQKDAVKGVKLHDKVNTLMSGLYLFYHYSAVQRSNLKRSFDTLDMQHYLPTKVSGTRWFAHTCRAITQIWKGYQGIFQHVSQVNENGTGKGNQFFYFIVSFSCLPFIHVLYGVII